MSRIARPSLIDGSAPQWIADALCGKFEGDQWFDIYGFAGDAAKEVCRQCPVRASCLEYGMDEKWGVWGGIGPGARRAMGWGRGRPGIDYDIPEWDR